MEYFEKVLWPAESIIDGTWASGAPPKEFFDFMLMREFKWSWRQLQETPLYVQMFCWDFLQRVFEKESNDAKAANKGR